ncbi:BMP family ABC transporter substrate-binding protein [Nocardioides zeae]|uniref:BMP family ABC transporter substrate-binding protein n=1 Tax=Nocardioides imazamoxiresistens TaxID=3231893 RepID=A0ABU3PU97_9ACTN|nr:BMP family ABC transporter substrate-binding protein [Nocardioides zeae]MDT9592754.1 BMP family ABC transporter substrate-binding protein [Nocardioides zeae]
MKRNLRLAAVVGASLTLLLTACGERADEGDSGNGGSSSPSETREASDEQFPDFLACMVSDSGGFDDQSFNETSYAGLQGAADIYGVQTAEAESTDPSQFADNIQGLIDEGCNQITTVGFLLGDATLAAATDNPDVDFSIVDFAYDAPTDNLKGLVFDTVSPSFLAGYTAAATSESGVVGMLGGQNIPTVTDFMDGFAQGVEYYNEEKGGDVQVLGQDSFTDSFEDQTAGQSIAQQLIGQGADVIFPVAGPAGLGALQAARDAGAFGVWVDTDGTQSTEFGDILLTSVVKGMDVAVETAIYESAAGEFTNEVFVGTLENEGVGLADFGDAVSDETASEVDDLRQQIIDGDIQLDE